MQSEPRCTDIVDLPYSMSAMDHLEPIMYRNNLRVNQQTGERVIQKVCVCGCVRVCVCKSHEYSKVHPYLHTHLENILPL